MRDYYTFHLISHPPVLRWPTRGFLHFYGKILNLCINLTTSSFFWFFFTVYLALLCRRVPLSMPTKAVQTSSAAVYGCTSGGMCSGRAWLTPAQAAGEDEVSWGAHWCGVAGRGDSLPLPQGGAVCIQPLLPGNITSSSYRTIQRDAACVLQDVDDAMRLSFVITCNYFDESHWSRPCSHVVWRRPEGERSLSGTLLLRAWSCCWTTCTELNSHFPMTTSREWLLLPSCSM